MPYHKLKLPLNTAQSYAKPWCGLGGRAYILANLVPWGDQPLTVHIHHKPLPRHHADKYGLLFYSTGCYCTCPRWCA
jgi:hypothetical protein